MGTCAANTCTVSDLTNGVPWRVSVIETNEVGLDARMFMSTDDGGSWVPHDGPPVAVRALATSQGAPVAIYAGGIALAPGAPQLFVSPDAATWAAVVAMPLPVAS